MALNLVADTVVAERFRLVRPLGKGGMGEVWLAHHQSLGIPCALKFIFPEAAADDDLRARFDREARAAAQLRSPHVVQILDNGVWQGAPYIAMELLEGEDLAQRLERVGRLDAQSTVAVIGQVARALTKAHSMGLVHRDLKPANIFLVRDDDREIAKVLDFGIAKSSSMNMGPGSLSATKTGSVLGTPVYMSPEQAQGTKAVDHRSDLWSLAVVTFECLTGRLPFDSSALGDLFLKIMVHPLPVPSQYGPLPASFDAWWARAASRYPEQRFQSAKDFVDALAQALGQSEISTVSRSFGGGGIAAPGERTSQVSWPFVPAQTGPLGSAPAHHLTGGPVVAPLQPARPSSGPSPLVLPLIGFGLGSVLIAIVAAVLFFRPTKTGSAGPDPAGISSSASIEAAAPPPASAAPIVAPASAAPTEIAASAVPSATAPQRPTVGSPAKPPATAKPPIKAKKPDFGI